MAKKSRAPQPQARMKEVALRAKVSAMSVSRALRFPDQVNPETLRRVQKAVREIGYVPNQLAGGLKATRTTLAAAIVPSVRNSLFASTLQGLTNTFRKNGINLMLGDSEYSQIEEEALIRAFLAHRPCGLVLHNSTHTSAARRLLQKSGVPIVEVGNLTKRPIDLMVSYSNFEAAKAMTQHLLGRGYRNIVFVGLPVAGNERVSERQRGYIAAMTEAGRGNATSLVETSGGFDNGARMIVEVIERHSKADAVFFAGDVLVIGAMMECQRRGWRVPDQIAIAGFDDFEISAQLATPITTLDIPRYRIGEVAADLIMRRLNGETGEIAPIDVGFRILERKST